MNELVKVEMFDTGSSCVYVGRLLDINNPYEVRALRNTMEKEWGKYKLEKEKNGKR